MTRRGWTDRKAGNPPAGYKPVYDVYLDRTKAEARAGKLRAAGFRARVFEVVFRETRAWSVGYREPAR